MSSIKSESAGAENSIPHTNNGSDIEKSGDCASKNSDLDAQVSTSVSPGVIRAELMCKQYEKSWLKFAFYSSVLVCAYCYQLDFLMRLNFQVYATSSYNQHSLYTTVNVIRAVIAAASQPTIARLADKFGRFELIVASILFYAVGTIIESQAYDVQRFAGGAVLYQIGYSGIQLMMEISLSDMSTLNWRLFATYIPALPYIINTWVSGDIAADLLASHSWSYAIGIWAFIFPLSSVPLLACFIHMRLLAGKTDAWKQYKAAHKRVTDVKAIALDLFWGLDVVGIVLIICVFGFLLVPLTLAGGKTTALVSASSAWAEAKIIVPLVIGVVLVPFLFLWESRFAKFPVVPLPLVKDRGVWSALIMGCLFNFIYFMPNDFMYTVLIVGMNTSVKAAFRITSLFSFVGVITGPLLGLLMVKVRRIKPFIIFGCTFWFISTGILYHYRGSNDGIHTESVKKGVIGGLCLMGFALGSSTYATQLSIQTVTNHEYMAVVLGIFLAFCNIGIALGVAVSGAVWTQLMPNAIAENMVAQGANETLAAVAYLSPFTFILTEPWGSPARIAVALAYSEIQRKMCIVGLCLCVLLIIMSLFLRNHYLASVQSLDNGSEKEGSKQGGKVVINNNDDDPIADFFRGIFGKLRTRNTA